MAPSPAAFEAALQDRLRPTLAFLESLVRTNSFTVNADGVRANAWIVASQFSQLGFTAKELRCAHPAAGNHLVLDTGARDPAGPVVACVSHLDTVYPPEEEARNGFSWRPEGERVFGPGTCDIKGGTALMYLLLSTMHAVDPELFGGVRWVLLFNAAEEVLAPDFSDLCLRTLPKETRACLIFEADGQPAGPRFSLVKARKGSGGFTVHVTGRGAHSGGRYADGANAIHQLARVIDRAQGLTDLAKETTVNVGVVRGGSVTNRVPHEAVAELEVRAFDRADFERVRDALLGFTGPGDVRAASDGFACQVRVTQDDETPPWPENPQTQALVDHWQRAAASLGYSLDATRRGGLSDGNRLACHFPTIDGLGPRGGNMHVSLRSADGSLPEFVDTTSFVPKALVNYLAIRGLLSRTP